MNYNHELTLSVDKKSWQLSSVHGTEAEKSRIELFKKIWNRDKNKCYFCNFESSKFQEIHHLDDNHKNYEETNLVTVCPLCHQSFHLNTVNITSGGKIIWLPEISQQDLNHLCRAIFIAMQNETHKYSKIALTLYQDLEKRKLVIEQHIQGQSSDPGMFAQALLMMKKTTPDKYEIRKEFLFPFKILHSPSRFPIQTKHWATTSYENLNFDSWLNLF